MINLLPNETKKTNITEYKTRILIISLFFASTLMLISIILMVPSFVLLTEKERAASERLRVTLQNASQERMDMDKSLSETNKSLTLLQESNKTPILPFIDSILSKKGGIKINSFVFQTDASNNKTIRLQGVSPTRDTFLSFVRTLQNEGGFREVSTPISNFIRDRDIEFTIEIFI